MLDYMLPLFILTGVKASVCLVLTDELGDFTSELKLSFFQLGISPQILASILMQVNNYLKQDYMCCSHEVSAFYIFSFSPMLHCYQSDSIFGN